MLCVKGSRETSLDFYKDILGDKIGETEALLPVCRFSLIQLLHLCSLYKTQFKPY